MLKIVAIAVVSAFSLVIAVVAAVQWFTRPGSGSLSAPEPDAHGNQVLSRAGKGLLQMAADGERLYFTIERGPALLAVPKQGGPTVVLTRLPGLPEDLAVDERFVWVASQEGVLRVAKEGGDWVRVTRYPTPAYAVASTPIEVLWLQHDGIVASAKEGGQLRRVAGIKAGSGWTSTATNRVLAHPTMAVHGDRAYVSIPNWGVGEVALAGGALRLLSRLQPEPFHGLALDGGRILVHLNGGTVWSLPAEGGQPGVQVCATAVANSAGFAHAGEDLWLGRSVETFLGKPTAPRGSKDSVGGTHAGSHGGLYRCRWRTGEVSGNLAPGTESVVAVVADRGTVFFGDAGTGAILRRDVARILGR